MFFGAFMGFGAFTIFWSWRVPKKLDVTQRGFLGEAKNFGPYISSGSLDKIKRNLKNKERK